jgi:hypothetical protein
VKAQCNAQAPYAGVTHRGSHDGADGDDAQERRLCPPKRYRPFRKELVGHLLDRQGLGDERRVPAMLGPDEWWLGTLARTFQLSPMQLRDGVVRGWLPARTSPAQGLWIVWANAEEVARVGHLLRQSRRGVNVYPAACTTPKPRLNAPAGERS